VELIEELRRESEHDRWTMVEVAKTLGVHKAHVKQAIEIAEVRDTGAGARAVLVDFRSI
jgi:hypothetical protein